MSDNRFEFRTDTKKIKSLFSGEINKEEIVMLPVSEIYEVSGIQHPFEKSLYDGIEELAALIQAAGGILQPAVVRPRQDEGYEILIGRRRRLAAMMLDMDKMPAIIRDVDNATAQLIITDNLGQRPKIYPSERAMAYKLEIEALKQQGKTRDFEGAVRELLEMHFMQSLPEVINLEAREIIAKIHKETPRTISYYLRLNNLIPALLDRVDDGSLPIRAGVELSYLSQNEQRVLEEILQCKKIEMTIALARELREAAQDMEVLSKPIIDAIIDPPGEVSDKPRNKKTKLSYQLALKRVNAYCKNLKSDKAELLARLPKEELQLILIQALEAYLISIEEKEQ